MNGKNNIAIGFLTMGLCSGQRRMD